MDEKTLSLPSAAGMEKRIEELQRMATRDALSGLMNRDTLERCIKERLAAMTAEETCALFIVDLDDFKRVNDTLGHQAGDQAIRRAGKVLSGLFRASDIVGRLGGDEFIVLLPGADWSQAEALAGRICDQLPGLASKLELGVPVGMSVGVHLFDPAAEPLNQAYQQADVALYAAKRNRGCWVSTRSLREL